MRVHVLLLFLCLSGAVGPVWLYGPVFSDPLLISVIRAFAAAILVLMARPRTVPQFVVVDGSNVMHGQNGAASIETERQVSAVLVERGFVPLGVPETALGQPPGAPVHQPRPDDDLVGAHDIGDAGIVNPGLAF